MPPSYPYSSLLRQRLTHNLDAFARRRIDDDSLRRAAVALVVAAPERAEEEACLLLTRRPQSMRRHAGQFALPGGRLDEGETFEQAALRELGEELGLVYDPERIIGPLDDYQTRSGFCIRPFVVWGGTLEKMQPDPSEVASVFQIPLSDLDSPAIPLLSTGADEAAPVLSAPIASINTTVHAPTAALLYQFREVAMNGRATRVAHFDQPAFAWR